MNISQESNIELLLLDANITLKRRALKAREQQLADQHKQVAALLLTRKFDTLITEQVKGSLKLVPVTRLDTKALLKDAEPFGILKPDYEVGSEYTKLTTSYLMPVTLGIQFTGVPA